MNARTYCAISATLFTIVALVHLTRLLNGWPVAVDGFEIPMLVSWIGTAVPGLLAIWGFRSLNSMPQR